MAYMETAIILAGGRSSRMGFDKQFLKLQDKYVIEMIAEKLRKIFKELILVTSKPEEYIGYGFILADDEVRNFGPLAGIHAGLKSSGSMHNYVVACDMPFTNLKYIRYMMELIERYGGNVDGVITKLGNWIEPFNAFYSKNLINRIEKSMEKGEKQINLMLQGSDMLYISEAKAREFSPDWKMFTNINTLKDYESLVQHFSKDRR